MEKGTRVTYVGDWYPGQHGRGATVQYESEGYTYVTFDYRPHLGMLPCEPDELEVLNADT